jgi:hypothetical protein
MAWFHSRKSFIKKSAESERAIMSKWVPIVKTEVSDFYGVCQAG